MKNIGASAGVFPAQGKKEEEGEKYIRMENEMKFHLNEAPEYQISAVAVWGENARGDVVEQPDIYFRHVLTGALCESAWGCLIGWSECDDQATEKWETLCQRIEDLPNLEEIICDEKTMGV